MTLDADGLVRQLDGLGAHRPGFDHFTDNNVWRINDPV
jgi:hypothetical protein